MLCNFSAKQLSDISFDHLVPPSKDVDGFHAQIFSAFSGFPTIPAATLYPKGILTLLSYYKIPLSGKRVLLLGEVRSWVALWRFLCFTKDTVTTGFKTQIFRTFKNSDGFWQAKC